MVWLKLRVSTTSPAFLMAQNRRLFLITKDRDQGAAFMRDNMNGGLVVKAVVRKDGSIRYQMECGHSYLIKERDREFLSRFDFRPKFKAATHE